MATLAEPTLTVTRVIVNWLSAFIASDVAHSMLAWMVGFLSAIFAEPIRYAIFRPKLNLEFGNGPEFKTRTPEQASYVDVVNVQSNHEAEYIRIKVVNSTRRIAKSCHAYLVAIEKEDERGYFRPTLYCDSIALAWSCRSSEQRFDSVDLPFGVAQFVDVVSTRNQKNVTSVFKPEIQIIPMRYINLFSEQGTFRFRVQISGENVKPVFLKIVFRWAGVWDGYTAERG